MDRPASTSTLLRQELAALLGRVAAGERAALAEVYERTSAKLYGICLRILGSEAEAQEALQEAYLTVWRKAGRFDGGRASPITWLALIAQSRAIDQRRRRRTLAAEPIEAAGEVPDLSAGADELAASADEQARLHHCLDGLDEKARTMIRAAFLDGLTYPELAAREGVPLGTMKSWIRRGLMRLKGCMEG
ncbi:sigma-70 family RNA polymerase sigma factor [Sphingomonas astaxanthinifaciens]|nr:sigma-70 family RNA polymerase sigma factor [Sphingomonas astaxanthinifaciens]